MEETDWDRYGTGNYEKCADCMVHSGYEATAVMDAVKHPLKALGVALRGVAHRGRDGARRSRSTASARPNTSSRVTSSRRWKGWKIRRLEEAQPDGSLAGTHRALIQRISVMQLSTGKA